ncbi:MAG TPA: hypothetical protein VGG48_05835 [Rhizomicrobium sp.]|jgi:hypothetical protein
MSDWGSLFNRAVTLVASEPPPVAIAIVLLVGLFAILALEGMRASLTPRRKLIRYLERHAPDDYRGGYEHETREEEEDAPMGFAPLQFAQPAEEQAGRPRSPYRSAGSRRVRLRRSPSDLLDRAPDENA